MPGLDAPVTQWTSPQASTPTVAARHLMPHGDGKHYFDAAGGAGELFLRPSGGDLVLNDDPATAGAWLIADAANRISIYT